LLFNEHLPLIVTVDPGCPLAGISTSASYNDLLRIAADSYLDLTLGALLWACPACSSA
jgi:hypothetical protein